MVALGNVPPGDYVLATWRRELGTKEQPVTLAPEDEALDKGRILAVSEECEAGEQEFDVQCVEIAGSNDCNDDEDSKLYAAGVRVIADDELEIVSYGFVNNGHLQSDD